MIIWNSLSRSPKHWLYMEAEITHQGMREVDVEISVLHSGATSSRYFQKTSSQLSLMGVFCGSYKERYTCPVLNGTLMLGNRDQAIVSLFWFLTGQRVANEMRLDRDLWMPNGRAILFCPACYDCTWTFSAVAKV
jgi:hypothetical protein